MGGAAAVRRALGITGGVALLALPPGAAWACSEPEAAPGGMVPPEGAVVGVRPLLAGAQQLTLIDSAGNPVGLEEVAAAELEGVVVRDGYREHTLVTARPVADLSPGEYVLDSDAGRIRFTVGDPGPPAAPPSGSTMEVVYYRPDDIAGCNLVCASNHLEGWIVVPNDTAPYTYEASGATYLVTERNDEGERRWLQGSLSTELSERIPLSHPELRQCLTLQRIGGAGDPSEPVNLGCVDPDDEDNPRVRLVVLRGGCSVLGSGSGSGCWVLLAALGLGRRRARRRAGAGPPPHSRERW